MAADADEWVCLECYNRWEPRSDPDGKAQCSNSACRGRFTFPLPLVERHVEDIQQLIDEQPPPIGEMGELPQPLQTLPDLISTGKQMVKEVDRPRARQGLDLLEAMQEITEEWEGEEVEPVARAIDRLHEREQT